MLVITTGKAQTLGDLSFLKLSPKQNFSKIFKVLLLLKLIFNLILKNRWEDQGRRQI